jgi:hypothetical protein
MKTKMPSRMVLFLFANGITIRDLEDYLVDIAIDMEKFNILEGYSRKDISKAKEEMKGFGT